MHLIKKGQLDVIKDRTSSAAEQFYWWHSILCRLRASPRPPPLSQHNRLECIVRPHVGKKTTQGFPARSDSGCKSSYLAASDHLLCTWRATVEAHLLSRLSSCRVRHHEFAFSPSVSGVACYSPARVADRRSLHEGERRPHAPCAIWSLRPTTWRALDRRVQGTAQLHYGLAHSRMLDVADRRSCSAHQCAVREACHQDTAS
jgi:hypothetical protein